MSGNKNSYANATDAEALRLQQCVAKVALDTAQSFTIYRNFGEICSQYLDQPLTWGRKISRKNRELLTASISAGNDQLIAPLSIQIFPDQDLGTAQSCKTLRELNSLLYVERHGITPVAYRHINDGPSIILPVCILSIGYGRVYEPVHGPLEGVISSWDRYINDCRREWIREASTYLLQTSKNKCWYCGTQLFLYAKKHDSALRAPVPTASQTRRKFHVDHQQPLSRKGSDELENLVACCAFCNSSKGQKTVDEFRAYKANSVLSAFPDLSVRERDKIRQLYKFWHEKQNSEGSKIA